MPDTLSIHIATITCMFFQIFFDKNVNGNAATETQWFIESKSETTIMDHESNMIASKMHA